MAEVNWSAAAKRDLQTIHDRAALGSEFYARRFVEKLLQRTLILSDFPASGSMVPEFGTKDIRQLLFGDYRIIYLVEPIQVTIVRVFHAARLLAWCDLSRR